jgi:uncharacterized protein YndB with AHSA1/START domain
MILSSGTPKYPVWSESMGESDSLSLRVSVTVEVTAPTAFDAFTARIDDWWVREFTWSGPDCLDSIGIERRLGGTAYELGPQGFRLDWGRVLAWDPPQRIVLAWHIAADRVPQPDPARASEVEVHFHPRPGGTHVDLEHRYFDRHGPDGAAYRRNMAVGWEELLDRFATICGTGAGRPGFAAGASDSRPIRRSDSDHARGRTP